MAFPIEILGWLLFAHRSLISAFVLSVLLLVPALAFISSAECLLAGLTSNASAVGCEDQ